MNYQVVRRRIIAEGRRLDGRRLDEVRPLYCESSYLPILHGSSIFSRGDTQVSYATISLVVFGQLLLIILPLGFRKLCDVLLLISSSRKELMIYSHTGSMYCYTWSASRCSTFGFSRWTTNKTFYASLQLPPIFNKRSGKTRWLKQA